MTDKEDVKQNSPIEAQNDKKQPTHKLSDKFIWHKGDVTFFDKRKNPLPDKPSM